MIDCIDPLCADQYSNIYKKLFKNKYLIKISFVAGYSTPDVPPSRLRLEPVT